MAPPHRGVTQASCPPTISERECTPEGTKPQVALLRDQLPVPWCLSLQQHILQLPFTASNIHKNEDVELLLHPEPGKLC